MTAQTFGICISLAVIAYFAFLIWAVYKGESERDKHRHT